MSTAAGAAGSASRRGEEPYPDRGGTGGVVAAAVDGTASRRRLNPDRGGTGGVVGTASRRRLKYLASINDDVLGEDTDPDFEMEYIDIGNVDSSGRVSALASYRFEDAPSRARRRVRDGDVIISTVRTYLQAITQIREPSDNLVVSTGFAVVRPRPDRFDARYCRFALREPTFLAEVERRSVGVSYPAINATDLADIPISIHPLQTQRAIADHLDRETARLDALVAAKQRLLTLLAEKRRAVVTRGLDPRVPLRDSENPRPNGPESDDRLDDASAATQAWPDKRIRFLVRREPSEEKQRILSGAEQATFLPMESIGEQGELDCSATRYVDEVRNGYTQFFDGDVLVAKITPCFENGKGAIVKGTLNGIGFGTTELHVLTPIPGIDARWLYYTTVSDRFRKLGEAAMFGAAGQKRVPEEFVRNYHVPVPPLAEQRAIADYLDRETARLDALMAKVRTGIVLLAERRAALIATAVTGKLDVGRTPCW